MNNQNKVIEIAGKHLGKVGGEGYKATYDANLLVAIPRVFNRESYNIKEGDLPFVGADVWNAYEVSAITDKGLPVNGMLKIVYAADSPMHVESKSIKLYLNSFNMTKMGETDADVVANIERTVSRDLSEALQTEVICKMFKGEVEATNAFKGYADLDDVVDLNTIEFDTFQSDASQLELAGSGERTLMIGLKSDLLRSNCRVTNQPDWGDVYIYMETKNYPDAASLAKYIVSHRQVSHFHEEICEMMFVHLMEAFNPEKLMVACLYTRRGGLDINPVRATSYDLIPDDFVNIFKVNQKTLRQ